MQVKKFISGAFLFIGINILVLLISFRIIHYFEHCYQYHNWETDSDLLIIPQNKSVDLLIMGSSHARIFTRDKNHLRVENILHKSLIDIGKGGGEGGIVTNLVMLNYFYDQGDTAKQIIYFIDAWPFFSSKWNEKSYFLTNEPINADLLRLCFQYHVDHDVMLNYFKSKYTIDWLERKPKSREINNDELHDISREAIEKRLASLYIEPYDVNVFNHYAFLMEEVIQLARAHHAKLTFIFPPTLLDDNRGKDKVLKLLSGFKTKYGTDYYDYSNVIQDYTLFYNHDHLNTKGVAFFTDKYLAPLL